ncbi:MULTISPECIES: FecCD family ABC transporter permease [Paenibacillus]|uniref:Iron ABC transporter permease n=2 Tax=Paenibacillus TaxID=44249 RepID=A0ABT4E5B2_PAEAL|nr:MULTISPECIES: iron ABC transporter permease [Paenibacillus]MCY9528929.1 iron ABC transporter permease [Paenibacillus alvei]TQR43982.1 iron ABC transporter permease [Paenibacillus sp. SDF0028]GAV12716.1 iron(3+)-hydroxamate import system permease protein FhuB [Paenibacillus sp. NAIST15-1]SDG29961.1 iron complex transport system permease protein [Paenibacillus sp. cl6col]
MVNSNQRTIPFIGKLIVGILLCAGMFVVAMVFGAADTSLRDVWLALTSNATSDNISVLRDIRLPREIGAMVVGAALAVAGAIMQGMTRNPLADPGLLGLTAGANAALAITLALIPGANYYAITIACFIGAAVGAFIVFGIGAMKRGGFSPLRIVLAGAAVTAFLIAVAEGTGLYFKISREISLWTAGGLIGTNWSQLQIIVPVVLVGILIAIGFSRQLTILSLNEEVAVGLGQKTLMVKIILFIVIVLLAGASVALVGNMAFIGLMIPHIVRAMVGTDYRFILPMSIFTGATFMLLADTLGRTINSPYETPVAAIVAMLGLPFFLFIVHKGGKAFS